MEGQPPLQLERRPSRPEEDGLRIWSCVTCRRRKVKCDRKDPCANCLRNNIDCQFPVTGRLPRRSRDPNVWKSPAQKQSELLGRLRRLESLVTEMTGQLEDGRNHPPSDTQFLDSASSHATGQLLQDHSSIVDANMSQSDSLDRGSSTGEASAIDSHASGEIFEDFGRLVIERAGALQVDKGFWSIFCDEVDHIFQAIHDDSYSVQDTPPPPGSISQSLGQQGTQCHGFVLGGPHGGPCMSAASSLDDLSPLPSQMLYIWKSYVENVDPFIKILHVPTIDSVVSRMRGNFSSLGPNTEALLFAISFAAVVSLEEDEVLSSFRVPRTDLISRFRLCTERALAHCQFLTTDDIIVFQAFVVYVTTLPHVGEQKLASSLTGSLVRVAASLKLHIDQDNQAQQNVPLDAVKAECRRRLWWQVCFIDSRSRLFSLPGLSISESSFDTKPPSNIADTLLQVDSTGGVPAASPTAMSLAAIRCQNWLLNRSIRRELDASLDRHLEILKQARRKIETEHLQYLEPDNDFDSLVAEMAYLFFTKVEKGIYRHHLRRCIAKRDDTGSAYDTKILAAFFNSSVAILEAMHNLKTKPAWKRWRWQLQGQFPWRTVGDVFIQMCQMPWTHLSEKAWVLARKLVDELPPESRRDVFWERLSSLASSATAHRDLQLAKERADAGGAVGSGVDAGVPGFAPLSAEVERDTVDGPANLNSSDCNGARSQFWMRTGDQGDFGSSNTTFATVDGCVAQNDGADNLFSMAGAPMWLEWDDLIDMDLF